jgi:ATP:ADP antiporter, AAA family
MLGEAAHPRPKSIVETVLSLFAEVRPGEGASVLLLTLNVFLLLLSYYLLKTVREPLILSLNGGAELSSYSYVAQALLLLGIIPAYGAFASRVGRIRLITWVTLIFVSNLLLFYALGVGGWAYEGIVFFIWVGIFNVLIVAQFWSFANDLYSQTHGKRLFPVIAVGGSLGSLVGAKAAAMMFHQTGPYRLMLIAAGLLVVGILISRIIHHRASVDQVHFGAPPSEVPLAKTGALELLVRDRYLLFIGLMVLLLNIVNSTGEFLLRKFVVAEAARTVGSSDAARQAFIGVFYGNYEVWYNSVGLVLQMFLVSRLFRYAGVRAALFVLPCIALGSYAVLLALPFLPVMRWAKIVENGVDYSVQNTTVHALFLPTSREAKYKAKAAIDTFFKRAGDVLQAGIIYAGTGLALGIKGFMAINLSLILVWLVVAWGIARKYRRIGSRDDKRDAELRSAEGVVPPAAAPRPAGVA